MHSIGGKLAARQQITEISQNEQMMDGTIKYRERSILRTDILNKNAFLDMTTATGKLFQIGTILEEKKYLLRLHLFSGTVSLYGWPRRVVLGEKDKNSSKFNATRPCSCIIL